MANDEDLARLRQGVASWNGWRAQNPEQRVDLRRVDFRGADLCDRDLSYADLHGADLSDADLRHANLHEANLIKAILIRTDLRNANLTGCRIFGISAWDLRLEEAKQRDLVITDHNQPKVTVDNLEVAQFIYLLLYNEKIRDVIDTITSKVVLILGRFTPERKAVLDALRGQLRKHDYLPVLFDFDKPVGKDLTGTISTLANMARFIVADLTDPSCTPHELAIVIPTTVVPLQPILLEGMREYGNHPARAVFRLA